MTLPATNSAISFSQIDTELTLSATAQISLNDTSVRTLFGTASGQISMSTGWGKSNSGPPVTITISANIQNFNMYNNRLASQHGAAVTVSGAYAAGSTVTVVINSGVVVGSSSNASYSFDTGTGWNAADSLKVTNNGYIVGTGGNGNGGAGGPAFRAQRAVSVTNNNIIGGGGGAGGMGQYIYGQTNYGKGTIKTVYAGGGGGSGGAGYNAGAGGGQNGANSGSVGVSGSRPSSPYADNPSPGAAGTTTAGGAPGAIYGLGGIAYTIYANGYIIFGGNGGAGGGLGAAGAGGGIGSWQSGAMYGYGVVGAATAGGAGGACTNGNVNITWVTAGSRYGTLG